MNRILSAPLAFVVLLILLAVSIGRAQPLADRLPPDTLAYLGWAGAQNLGADYDSSNWKGFLDASQPGRIFQDFLPRAIARATRNNPDAVHIAGALSSLAKPMWQHPSAIVFAGVNFRTIIGPMPRIAVICQAGADGAAIKQSFDALEPRMKSLPVPVRFEQTGDFSILSIGYNVGEKILADPGAPALSVSPQFISAVAKVNPKPAAIVYIDFEGILKLSDQIVAIKSNPQQQQKWTSARQSLGLDGLKRLIVTGAFDGKDFAWTGFVDAPAPRTGLVARLFSTPPIPDELVRTIPASATCAWTAPLDLSATVNGLKDFMSWSNPRDRQEFDQSLNQASAFLNLDIDRDVLQPFGPAWAIYWSPDTGGNSLTTFTLVNRANDAAKVDAALTRIAEVVSQLAGQAMQNQGAPKLRQLQAGDTTIKFFPVPAIAPAWAIKDGNVYLALYPQIIASALDASSKSLNDNPEFAALRQRLKAPPGAQFTWIDIPRTAADGYAGMLALSQLTTGFADLFGIESPAMLLPPISKITPHLSPAASASWSAEDGMHFAAITPFPGAASLTSQQSGIIGETALMTSILLPSLNRARETANRVKCASNLRQIGQGCMMYSNENRGAYPPDLGSLHSAEDLSLEVFTCPSGDTAIPPDIRSASPAKQADWINEHSDYIYAGKGMKNTAGPEAIVCYEKPDAHGGDGMNILFGDGHVEFLNMPEAKRLIEKGKPVDGTGL